MSKKRPQTDNRGAADERAQCKAHAKRLVKATAITLADNLGEYRRGYRAAMKDLITWLDSRSKRFRKRKGGL